MDHYIRCKRCIMDNASDTTIQFDSDGNCNYCTDALSRMKNSYFPGEEGKDKLDELIGKIKKAGQGKSYDCVMGLSGGLDSSYLAYLGHKWGLRVLAIHIDDGFDTEVSKSNLKKLIEKTGFEYVVIKPDPEQYAELTKAYMRAGVPNIAIPQDNVLFAAIYQYMRKYHVQYFLSGANFALECILQRGNTYTAYDLVNMRDIFSRFGNGSIDRLPVMSTIQKFIDKLLLGVKTVCPLDYVDYNKNRAFEELAEFCGFEYYGRKHLENALTAFIQLIWFPQKFGVDKRTSHLSSMIVSGQLTRDEALQQLEEKMYDPTLMNRYLALIKDKFGISDDELDMLLESPAHQHNEYKTEADSWMFRVIRAAYHLIKKQ